MPDTVYNVLFLCTGNSARSTLGKAILNPVGQGRFTVCDSAAGEICPIWSGRPMTAHWGIADPAAVDGPEFERRAAFSKSLRYLRNRVGAFMNPPLASIGRMVGTTIQLSNVA